MIFNFNIKDILREAEASIRGITTGRDVHHMEKKGIKRIVRPIDWNFADHTIVIPKDGFTVQGIRGQ
jgi:hypothetical protein